MKLRTCSIGILFCAFLPGSLIAQTFGNDFHTVRVTVQPIVALQLTAGNLSITITGANATAGQDQMVATDQSTTLLWGINSSTQKITAETNLASPQFLLKVLALSPTQGTPAPELTLTQTPSDFLLNVGRSSGSCSVRYTGIALASQGTGSDPHTIRFTVAAQ